MNDMYSKGSIVNENHKKFKEFCSRDHRGCSIRSLTNWRKKQ